MAEVRGLVGEHRDVTGELRARLDRDEEVALRAGAGERADWTVDGRGVDFDQYTVEGFHPSTAEHVARHDPGRVLRGVAAQRRILEIHARTRKGTCEACRTAWPCATVQVLVGAAE